MLSVTIAWILFRCLASISGPEGHIPGHWVANGQRFGLGDEPVHVVVVYGLVHQMSADDHAALALVEEAAVRQGVHPVVQVGVGEHDHRVVAASSRWARVK